MFGNKKKEHQRFYIKSYESVPSLGKVVILVDRHTGVNYLQTFVGTSGGITPLIDKNGHVIVEKTF